MTILGFINVLFFAFNVIMYVLFGVRDGRLDSIHNATTFLVDSMQFGCGYSCPLSK